MTNTGRYSTPLRWTDGTVASTHAHPTPVRSGDTPPAERTRLRASVGRLLLQERMAQGWTQRELAAAAGCACSLVAMLETGARRPSESMTRRMAVALRPGGTPVEVAMLDIELRRAAGESLRRWRRRPWSARRQRVYDVAVRQLDVPDAADALACARLAAALAPPWRPPS